MDEEKVNRVYNFDMVASDGGVSYNVMEFCYFDVREVLVNGKPNGEYHIKPKVQSDLRSSIIFFQSNLSGYQVGAIDRDGALNLDYTIYAKAVHEMAKMNIDNMLNEFKHMDDYLYDYYRGIQ
jgi:hypothetical protein